MKKKKNKKKIFIILSILIILVGLVSTFIFIKFFNNDKTIETKGLVPSIINITNSDNDGNYTTFSIDINSYTISYLGNEVITYELSGDDVVEINKLFSDYRLSDYVYSDSKSMSTYSIGVTFNDGTSVSSYSMGEKLKGDNLIIYNEIFKIIERNMK